MSAQRRRRTKKASDDVLDAHEAGWLLGAHIETVRRLARSAKLPAYKVGKDWRFSEKALRSWMKSHHAPQRPPLALVVDDEKRLREMVALFLQGEGLRVALAESGEAALDITQQETPDIVLLDLKLPRMSGVNVLRTLHATKPALPVIIVTGYPDSNLLAEALQYPPVTLLPKPVDKDVLLTTVRRLLRGTTQDEKET